MKIRSKQINRILIGLAVMSCYAVIAIKIAPIIRIPSPMSEGLVNAINEITFDISMAYLSGGLIYLLTSVVRDRTRRQQQKWLIYDSIKTINGIVGLILDSAGVEKNSDVETVMNYLESNAKKDASYLPEIVKNANNIRCLVRKESLSGIIWSDNEMYCLIGIDNICTSLGYLLENWAVSNNNNLKTVAEGIIKLNKLSNLLTVQEYNVSMDKMDNV